MSWPDAVDEILDGDQAVALGHRTPARGVVLTPLTNFTVRDREAGTVEVLNSSIGIWRKLERISRDPQVAIAFHSRLHARTDRPEYVLVQGTARLTPLEDRGYLDRIRDDWERAAGPRDVGPLWERWQRIYHWRVGISVDVERIVVWPDLRCDGAPEVHGAPLPADPPAQRPPQNGTAPRVNVRRTARRIAKLPHALTGWVGADGFPVVVPVELGEPGGTGIPLTTGAGVELPPGGRRAGLLGHWFALYTYGQEQRRHTGWLEDGVYAPHTSMGYRMPASKTVFRLASGFETRRRFREGRKAGFIP